MHFSEFKLNNDTSECRLWSTIRMFYKDFSLATTPWIALVACDANATDAPQDTDIFTLAKDRGAVAAVRSFEACQIRTVR